MDRSRPPPASPDDYFDGLAGWQAEAARALRAVVREAAPTLDETIRWGHAVYRGRGPVLLIRAEPARLLFGFWRGQRLRPLEPRLKPGGRYEMATLVLGPDTPLRREVAFDLVAEAASLDAALGDPTALP